MDMESRVGNPEEGAGKWLCTGGGDLALGGVTRVRMLSPPPAEVLTISGSALFVPEPCPGDCAPWAGSDCAAERAREATGVGGLAGSFSLAGSSSVALGGEGAAVAGGARAGELVVSSKIVVALRKYIGLVFIVRSKRE